MEILLIIFILLTALFAGLYFSLVVRIVEVSDDAPEKPYKCNYVLKLQNEIKPYIKHEDGKVKLRIIK